MPKTMAMKSYEVMTVGDLRQGLEGVPDDWPVLLSRDSEGNGYGFVYSFDSQHVINANDQNEVYGPDEQDDKDEYYPAETLPVFVMWPV